MHRAALTLALFCSACEAPAPADAGSPSLDAGRDAASDAAFVCAADRECDDGVFCDGPERCVDARCVEGSPPCDAALETCDAVAETCSPIDCSVPDRDGDGHRSIACGGGDCDDDDAARNPGVMEVCDVADVDEDCDPSTYGVRDADMDDEPDARCCNGEVCGTDCDDMRAGVSPRVPEVCGNGLDDDCDGRMDEELLVDGFVDDDGDGWGDDARPMRACAGAEGFAARGGGLRRWGPRREPRRLRGVRRGRQQLQRRGRRGPALDDVLRGSRRGRVRADREHVDAVRVREWLGRVARRLCGLERRRPAHAVVARRLLLHEPAARDVHRVWLRFEHRLELRRNCRASVAHRRIRSLVLRAGHAAHGDLRGRRARAVGDHGPFVPCRGLAAAMSIGLHDRAPSGDPRVPLRP